MFWQQGCGRWSTMSLFVAFLLTALTFRWNPKITNLFCQWRNLKIHKQKTKSLFASSNGNPQSNLMQIHTLLIILFSFRVLSIDTQSISNSKPVREKKIITNCTRWVVLDQLQQNFLPFVGSICFCLLNILQYQGKAEWCIIILGKCSYLFMS